jgi:phospholipid/cholesterol/gamma-HCH transport system permease protein
MTPEQQQQSLEVSRTTTFAGFAKDAGERVAGNTGKGILDRAQVAGRACLLFYQAMGYVSQSGRALPTIIKQIEFVGFGSLVVLSLISGLTGMIMAVQMGATLEDYGALDTLGGLIAVTFCRELGPIWAAVIILARVGSAMAAELGTMAVNEEVDALRSMSIDPVRYLVMPRILALIIAMPLLTLVADFVGILGGALISSATFGITVSSFFESATSSQFLAYSDVIGGLIKSIFFACLIGTIACDQGLNTSDGAEGVGKSTTRTVVLSVIFVLLMDLFLTTFVQLSMNRLF